MRTIQPKLKLELYSCLSTFACKYSFVSLCFLFSINILFAQTPDFVQGKQYSADSYMEGIGIYATANGTIFNAGNFSGTIDFNPDILGSEIKTSAGHTDCYLTKTNPDGSLAWARNFGGKLNDFVKAMYVSDDYIYLVGAFSDTADFNPTEIVYNLISNGKEDGFIVKLNYQGMLVSATHLGGIANDAINSIAADSIDNIYIAGYFSNITDFDLLQSGQPRTAIGLKDMFMAKYQASGQLEYVATIGSSGNETFKSLQLQKNGNTLISGTFNGPMSVSTLNGMSLLDTKGSTDLLVALITAAGEINWVKTFGGKKNDDVSSILTLNDKFYISGSFSDSINFSDEINPVIKVSAGASDIFLLALDENGNFQNVSTGGSTLTDNATDLVFDGDNKIVQIGFFQNTLNVNTAQYQTTLQSKGLKDAFMLVFDTSLNLISAGNAGSNKNDCFNTLSIDNKKQQFVTGITSLNFDADLTSTENILAGYSRFNSIILKYDNCITSSQPTIIGPDYSICPTEQVTLTLSNNMLNDATNWEWRKGSCTGPVIGINDSLTIQQTNTTTYYVKGVGGCVTNANCSAYTVFSTGCFNVRGQADAIACNGGSTILKARTQFGVAPYSFSLDNVNFSSDSLFNVSAGTYIIYSKDAINRLAISAPVIVNQPLELNIAGVCYSPDQKYLGVLATGGTKPYQFSRNSTVFYNGIQRNKTAYVFTPVNPGVYTLTIRDSKNCTAVLQVNTDTLPICPAASPVANIGSSNKEKSKAIIINPVISVKPNPANDYFEILTETNTTKSLSVTDALGNTIYTDKKKNIRIRLGYNWMPGFYFLTIIENNKIYQYKLIKL